MLLRDPVHGLVAFDKHVGALVASLTATPEFQRLRRVRQLGLSSLVFPGAEHTRFAHALGAAHVMQRLCARIERLGTDRNSLKPDPAQWQAAIAAALLHDIGHGPLSHTFEEALPGAEPHERWTLRIIEDPGTGVHQALKAFDATLPSEVAALIRGTHPLTYLSRAVSGPLDVDRCDYLLRDSYMTGARYGVFDLDWLLEALTIAQLPSSEGRATTVLAIEGRKGMPAIEGFFLARHFMFQQVYHHKAGRAAHVLVRAIFARAAELIRAGQKLEAEPKLLRTAARGEPSHLTDYLALDDGALHAAFTAWQSHPDAILSELTQRLIARRLFKTIPLPGETEPQQTWQIALNRAREVAAERGANHHVHLDAPADTPYAEPTDDTAEGLWVQLRRPLQRLGDLSFILCQLRNRKVYKPRLVVPEQLREPITAAIADLL